MDISKTVQEIQYLLAPAVMVSSAALLLLGLQNKFSNLANRFRILNHEKRGLLSKLGRDQAEEIRLKNLTEQIDQLMKRAAYVKNAILLSYFGILCFVSTSILISLNIYTDLMLHRLIAGIFLLGLFALVGVAVLIILETLLFYHIMTLERKH